MPRIVFHVAPWGVEKYKSLEFGVHGVVINRDNALTRWLLYDRSPRNIRFNINVVIEDFSNLKVPKFLSFDLLSFCMLSQTQLR